jgi:dimethylargininase
MFTDAIVKAPCQNLTQGITTAELGQPDYLLAVQQHAAYVNALRHCGLHVTELEADEGHPDSTFIEDTALVTPACAIITRPGAESRRGETVSVANELRKFFPSLHTIEQPGTLDAGDVMMAGDHYYIGLSSRTNEHGAQQLIAILEHHGLHGSMVPMADGLHLFRLV